MKDLTISRRAVIALAMVVVLPACEDQSKKAAIEIYGGGFVLNYRLSQLTYGALVRQNKPFPPGAVFEVSFDMPGTAPKQIITVAAVDSIRRDSSSSLIR